MASIALRSITLLAAAAAGSPAAAQPASDAVTRGAQVYREVCMRCHAADPMRDRPASAARRENGVLTAIETQGPMRWIRNLLSDADIAAVQAWLDFVVLPPGALRPDTGIWWNPAEPGRGYVFEYGHGFAVFWAFYFGDDGRPDWATTAVRYDGSIPRVEGALAQFRGGQALVAAWREAQPAPSPGSVSVRLDAPAQATLVWPGGSVPIERALLNPGASPQVPGSGYPEPGIWWNPAEPGRGFAIDVQGTQLLLVAYLYDEDGRAAWFTTNGTMPTRFRFEGDWYRFADGQTLRGAFRPARRIDPPVARVAIDFDSPRAGTLTLPDGRRIPIVRFF
jgi:cytochrome c553